MHRRLLGRRFRKRKLLVLSSRKPTKPDWRTVIAVSEYEADYFRSYENKTTVVAGHAIRPRRTENVFASRKDLLYLSVRARGRLAECRFVGVVYGAVLASNQTAEPETRLVVVGDNTAPTLNGINDKCIVFRGRQPASSLSTTPVVFSLRRHASLLEFPTKSTRRLPMDFRQSSPHCWQVSSTVSRQRITGRRKRRTVCRAMFASLSKPRVVGQTSRRRPSCRRQGAQKRHSVRQLFRRSSRQRKPRKLGAPLKYLASRNSRICSRPDRTLTHPSFNPRRWRRLSASP